jgi:hypothetical protein
MPESLMFTCPEHGHALLPLPADPHLLRCPEDGCEMSFRLGAADGFPLSPLSLLEQGAAQHHELVLAHEGAGFSRSEAMQVLCTVISAGIMKGSGSG